MTDTHIHLAYRDLMSYGFMTVLEEKNNLPKGRINRDFTVEDYMEVKSSNTKFNVTKTILVEAAHGDPNSPLTPHNPITETKMYQKICEDYEQFVGFVMHIPVKTGKEGVINYLNQFRDTEGNLSKYLVGGRQMLMGMGPECMLRPEYLEGLKVVESEKLVWEIGGTLEHWKSAIEMCKLLPGLRFTLNHCGTENLVLFDNYREEWKARIREFSELPNVMVKLGGAAISGVEDMMKYLRYTIKTFGFDRCMAESNWFVTEVKEDAYNYPFEMTLAVMREMNATDEHINDVFVNNGQKCYNHL